jgi:transposase
MTWTWCPACLQKQRQIDELKDEVRRLKDLLRRQERSAAEGPFGSSTPSSKVPFKPSAPEERQARRGGAKPGHAGHGRAAVPPEEADRREVVPPPSECPHCGGRLELRERRRRTVREVRVVVVEKIVYDVPICRCARCGRTVQGRPPGVLPKGLYGNGLLAHVAIQHYLYGVPLGTLARHLRVGRGGLIAAMHQVAGMLASVVPRLREQYRRAPVKHADETGWRRDGAGGYAWLFATPDLSLFRLAPTRAARVALEVFGYKRLRGVLVVDRYPGYNRAPCLIQYCYAHLLRDLKDILKKFPDNAEVRAFVDTLAPLLSEAMKLRKKGYPLRRFRREARRIQRRIEAVTHAPARHPAIQFYQDIFRQHPDRLYHWTRDPSIPAENNRAERDLRGLVIARKVSYGSQSDNGAKTREVLMSVLHTLAKRTDQATQRFKDCLDRLALDPNANPFSLLFPKTANPHRN